MLISRDQISGYLGWPLALRARLDICLGIVLKPGLVGRLRVGIGPGLKKIRKRKTRSDPAKKPFTIRCFLFFFFIKTTSFWFKKKKIDPGDPVTRSKPETWTLNRVEFKNYASWLDCHGSHQTLQNTRVSKFGVIIKLVNDGIFRTLNYMFLVADESTCYFCKIQV